MSRARPAPEPSPSPATPAAPALRIPLHAAPGLDAYGWMTWCLEVQEETVPGSDEQLAHVAAGLARLPQLAHAEDQLRLGWHVAKTFPLTGGVRLALVRWLLSAERAVETAEMHTSSPESFASSLRALRDRLEQVPSEAAAPISPDRARTALADLQLTLDHLVATPSDMARVNPETPAAWMRHLYQLAWALERETPQDHAALTTLWELERRILTVAATHHKAATRQHLLVKTAELPASHRPPDPGANAPPPPTRPRDAAPWLLLLQDPTRLVDVDVARAALTEILATHAPWQPLEDSAAARIGLLCPDRPLREQAIRLLRPKREAGGGSQPPLENAPGSSEPEGPATDRARGQARPPR